jgi:hypothetical protein
MRGFRGEPVEVWLRSGRPARFVWRGRMHTVMFVLDRQVTPAATPADPAGSGGEGCECWRVEATPERSVPPATYELCRDLASGRWLLSRD